MYWGRGGDLGLLGDFWFWGYGLGAWGVDFWGWVGYGWGCDGLLAGFGCLLLLSAYIGVRGFCVCQTA